MNKISMQSQKPTEHKTEPALAPRSGASGLTGGSTLTGNGQALPTGFLIVNADDWGRDRANTDRALECVLRGSVSSVSAMVFMEDSERAADISRQHGVDTGLHLNLTTPFTVSGCPRKLLEHHRRLAVYLSGSRFAQVVFHPGLASSFAYVVEAQLKEFDRSGLTVIITCTCAPTFSLQSCCPRALWPGEASRFSAVRRVLATARIAELWTTYWPGAIDWPTVFSHYRRWIRRAGYNGYSRWRKSW
jgi:hypothetical protein